jgi:hypothetical protein
VGYRKLSARILFTGFACTWLLSGFAGAQETSLPMSEFTKYVKAQNFVEIPLPSSPPGDNAFLQTDGGDRNTTSEVDTSDEPLTIQLEHKRFSSSISFLYSAPDGDYLAKPGNQVTGGWQNSLIGGIAFDLNRRKATAVQLNTDVEMYGPVQQLFDRQQASGQDLTFDFGIVQLFPRNKVVPRSFRLELGNYQQWFVSQSLFASGPIAVREPDYMVSSTGVQAIFTLPENNMTFSLRYGTEHLAHAWQKPNAVTLQFSWTW